MKKKNSRQIEITKLTDDYEEWGTVLITAGKHKGRIGYYDNDEGRDLAVVYLGSFPFSKYIFIEHKYLLRLHGLEEIYEDIFGEHCRIPPDKNPCESPCKKHLNKNLVKDVLRQLG